MRTRALWVVGPGRAEHREETLSSPGPDDVLVRTLYSGVSRGTESLVLRGGVPTSEAQRMRAPFQAGAFPFPVKYGYIAVGEVEAGPGTGSRVFCLHPHQERFVVPSGAVTRLPDDLPAARAVLTAHLETAINGVWDAAPGPGDRVAVVGGGVVGCLVAWLIRQIPGTEVQLVDVNPDRAQIASALEVGFSTPAHARRECDLVVHASGAPDGLTQALSLAGMEATVLELSWFGDQQVALPLGEAFHARRLTIRSSQVGAIEASRRPRWDHERRLSLALRLLQDPRLDVLIDSEGTFDTLPQDLVRVAGTPGVLCHRVCYIERPSSPLPAVE